ncbi:LytR/AlgR family response regulator transcription factor [Marivirga arenosa]|uniref:LytTR family DNA-binding domain-containing protein n=1 Tax=Marivirga arenosa TaxID=3059076 RepID=A0AA49JCN9_9BACT|nr:LytTR family DNA-binding domain-containing protein [Marivirga sp. BKB1-2]WKK80028.2 LytTR family DNA-binding domain-containing protein [Marivirga sp. BKB1-2]
MKILIFEDEPLAQERIKQIIDKFRPNWEIVGTSQSIKDSRLLLQNNQSIDLIISDIHLADGNCFDVFENQNRKIPIIFLTAYDQHALQSFDHYCIDYVLKPLQEKRLIDAFEKFEELCVSQEGKSNDNALLNQVIEKLNGKKFKKRFLTKVGNKMLFKEVDEIAYFYAEDKIVYLKEIGSSKKYIVNFSLEELENQLLDPSIFYRINRSVIINLEALIEMKSYHNGRLKLIVQSSDDMDLIVARERVGHFKDWINQ